MLSVWSQLPLCSVVEIIRPGWNISEQIGAELAVSHLGFLLTVDSQMRFIHASSKIGRIVNEDAFLYFSSLLSQSVEYGIHIEAVLL